MDVLRIVTMSRAAWHALDPNMRRVRRGVRALLDPDTGERVAFVHVVSPGGQTPPGPWRSPADRRWRA